MKKLLTAAIAVLACLLPMEQAHAIEAKRITTDTATLNNNISGCATVQACLELIDDLALGGGSGSALDLGDDGANESTSIGEIATTADTNNVFTEPSANKLLIDLSKDWPKADTADDLTCTDCINATEIEDIYVLNAGDTITGAVTINDNNGAGSTLLTIGDSNDPDSLAIFGDLTVTGGDITLGTTAILSGGDTASLDNIDAINGTTETTLEGAIDIAGDVDGTGLGSVDLDELAVESELEGVMDLQDMQGAVTDGQVPNNITVDLATLATTATTANAGDSATAFFSSGTIEHERGGLEADVSAYDGLIGITGGAAYNVTGTTTQIIIFDGAGAPTVAALSGDATMSNAGVVTVADDSHAHTTSSISGLDISDDTNLAGTANEITLTGDTMSLATVLDLGGKTSFEIPNGASPTVDAFGEIAGDNDLWAAGRGAPVFYDGTAAVALIGALVSDPPSNGQVPKWNTGGTITWEDDTQSAGSATAWDDIADPDANATIAFAGFEQDITSSLDGGDILTMTDTDADASSDTVMLKLAHNDGADANVIYFQAIGDLDGTPATDYSFTQTGATFGVPITTTTLDTGQGANELYDMDQNVLQASAVTFATVDTGQGANELYDMDQNVLTTSAVTFSTLDTGQGANELYDMDQNVLTSSTPTFAGANLSSGTATLGTTAGTIDAGGATSFEVPNGADPTTNAFGEVAGDNDAWAASRGALEFFDGTASTFLVGVLASDPPGNGQVPKWNTGGTVTWEDDSSGGSTAWSAIGDAAGTGTIDFAGFDQDITSAEDGGDILTITNSDADRGSDSIMLLLADNDGADANAIYLLMRGDADGSPTDDFKFAQDGFTSLLTINAPTLTLTGTGTINGLDAIDGTTETTLEGALDLPQLQGQIGDSQIADGAVDGGTGGEVADDSLTAADIAADGVGESELLESMNFAATGAWDFGGASSLEMKNATSATIDADGEFYLETDQDGIVVQAGSNTTGGIASNTDVQIPLIQQKDMTLVEPDQIQTVMDAPTIFTVDSYNYPSGIKIVAIRLTTDASSSCSYNIEEWTSPTDGSPATIDAIATSSTSEVTETTITDADVATGGYVKVDLDTCNVNEAHITVYYYAKD